MYGQSEGQLIQQKSKEDKRFKMYCTPSAAHGMKATSERCFILILFPFLLICLSGANLSFKYMCSIPDYFLVVSAIDLGYVYECAKNIRF